MMPAGIGMQSISVRKAREFYSYTQQRTLANLPLGVYCIHCKGSVYRRKTYGLSVHGYYRKLPFWYIAYKINKGKNG